MGLVQANAPEYEIRSFYYTGTTALITGQPLCYQESPATASSTKGFAYDVEVPTTVNALMFAGIVPSNMVGITGPTWIELIVPRPGDILEVLVTDKGTVQTAVALSLDFDVPTLAGAERGAFASLNSLSTASSDVADNASALANQRLLKCYFMASVSMASETAGAAGVLHWVQFV